MRSRLAALMLMNVLLLLSAMNLLAAPVPDPSAVLDIGPPRKGKTAQENCKQEIECMKHPRGHLWPVGMEVKKLSSVARLKEEEIGSWLAKNLRIKEEDDGRRLRLTFQAGTRDEQVAILNAFLRYYMRDGVEWSIKTHEGVLEPFNKDAERYAKLAKEERDAKKRARWQELEANAKAGLEYRKTLVPDVLAEIDRLKQVKVVKWAK